MGIHRNVVAKNDESTNKIVHTVRNVMICFFAFCCSNRHFIDLSLNALRENYCSKMILLIYLHTFQCEMPDGFTFDAQSVSCCLFPSSSSFLIFVSFFFCCCCCFLLFQYAIAFQSRFMFPRTFSHGRLRCTEYQSFSF